MDDLRTKLIDTTDQRKAGAAMTFFEARMNDGATLAALVEIALEGEDAGDAPWAAANIIAEYPATLLKRHEAELRLIAAEQWDYLNRPAKAALAKIDAN
ncbi:MAG: hypothetical protein GC203_21210 [Phenylobacterium sp.]|uniref:hypothetical protein n=1 Tax=Phenylobacterium sp. TaxID=1871053 RepID=UPI0025D7EAB8|nr:hypothetical protein [Phenylobacterium sp.]MBI1200387.1 hypothetical protein [Phenylobacterium sp.]